MLELQISDNFDKWTAIFDDTKAHIQYLDSMDSFKKSYKVRLSVFNSLDLD